MPFSRPPSATPRTPRKRSARALAVCCLLLLALSAWSCQRVATDSTDAFGSDTGGVGGARPTEAGAPPSAGGAPAVPAQGGAASGERNANAGAAGEEPGGAGAGGAPPSFEAAVDRYAVAVCSSFQRCGPGVLAWQFGSYEHCLQREGLSVRWATLPPLQDPRVLDDCTAAWNDSACADLMNGDLPDCHGPGKTDDPCSFPEQCQSGICYTSLGQCGHCVDAVRVGDACQTDDDCPYLRCSSGKCAPFAKLGEGCRSAADCAGWLDCHQGRCAQPVGTLGAGCDPEVTLNCDSTQSLICSTSSSGTCQLISWGDKCSAGGGSLVCGDQGVCTNGKCLPHPLDDEPCDASADHCEYPSVCANGVCLRPDDSALCGAPGSEKSDDDLCTPACAGDTPICSLGKCVACLAGDTVCVDNGISLCGADATWRAPVKCPASLPQCSDGVCLPYPSCRDLPLECGPYGDEACCDSPSVAGGDFLLGYDGVNFKDDSQPRTIASFRLDRFEVTAARFAAFVADYDAWREAGHPLADEGAQPLVAGTGWEPSFDANLPPDAATLAQAINGDFGAWFQRQSYPALPMDFVDWYEAFAFCVWDGGRLPARAEWSYAAAAGNEQRVYPWSQPAASVAIDDNHALFCGAGCSFRPVGSVSPVGDGKFAQADLAGSVAEWARDTSPDNPSQRLVLGGGYSSGAAELFSAAFQSVAPNVRAATLGFRCARDD